MLLKQLGAKERIQYLLIDKSCGCVQTVFMNCRSEGVVRAIIKIKYFDFNLY